MSAADFHKLLNRFYAVANKAVVDGDGLVDKYVGDEVVAMYLPIVGPRSPAARSPRRRRDPGADGAP